MIMVVGDVIILVSSLTVVKMRVRHPDTLLSLLRLVLNG